MLFLLCTFCTFVMVGAGYYLDINYLFPGYSPFVSTTSSISSPILFTHFIFCVKLWNFGTFASMCLLTAIYKEIPKYQSFIRLIHFTLFNSGIASFFPSFLDHFWSFWTNLSLVLCMFTATHKKAVVRILDYRLKTRP